MFKMKYMIGLIEIFGNLYEGTLAYNKHQLILFLNLLQNTQREDFSIFFHLPLSHGVYTINQHN